MWFIKLEGKYLTMAGKWTNKIKDARKFTSEEFAKRWMAFKHIGTGAIVKG
jgi:hypothetical protein